MTETPLPIKLRKNWDLTVLIQPILKKTTSIRQGYLFVYRHLLMVLVYLINTWPLISQFQGYLYEGIIKQFLNLDMSITTYYLKEKLIQEIKLFFFVSSTMQMATLLVYIYHRLGHPDEKLVLMVCCRTIFHIQKVVNHSRRGKGRQKWLLYFV